MIGGLILAPPGYITREIERVLFEPGPAPVERLVGPSQNAPSNDYDITVLTSHQAAGG
jgi:hypothetical protein